jgi:DNA-binding response OmpR family regulator
LLFRSALRQGHREEVLVSALLLLTNTLQSSADVLPALGLLSHNVRILPAELTGLVDAPTCDVVLLDGRHDLVHVRGLGRLIRTTGIEVPLVLVVTEGGLAVVAADWGFDDVVLDTAGPAEVEARLRLVTGRLAARRDGEPTEPNVIRSGEVVIDEATYTAKVGGKALDLTFKEFELLKFLAQHPGRVFSRQQLLQEVWGYDYFGGTRTVDVHVRRLRAKLGPEHDALIGTVRNVGYRFVLPVRGDPAERPAPPGAGSEGPGARRAGTPTPRRRIQP